MAGGLRARRAAPGGPAQLASRWRADCEVGRQPGQVRWTYEGRRMYRPSRPGPVQASEVCTSTRPTGQIPVHPLPNTAAVGEACTCGILQACRSERRCPPISLSWRRTAWLRLACLPSREGHDGSAPTVLSRLGEVRRDGRAAECEALEKPWDASPRGFESLSLRRSEGIFGPPHWQRHFHQFGRSTLPTETLRSPPNRGEKS